MKEFQILVTSWSMQIWFHSRQNKATLRPWNECEFPVNCHSVLQPATTNEPSQTSDQASGNRTKPTQESFSVNPDTGIPSPRSTARHGHPVEPAPPPTSSGVTNPVMVVREVGPSAIGVGLSPGNIRQERKYDPSSYQGRWSLLGALRHPSCDYNCLEYNTLSSTVKIELSSQVAYQAGVYSGFWSVKRLGSAPPWMGC